MRPSGAMQKVRRVVPVAKLEAEASEREIESELATA